MIFSLELETFKLQGTLHRVETEGIGYIGKENMKGNW